MEEDRTAPSPTMPAPSTGEGQQTLSAETLRAYSRDWAAFVRHCSARGVQALPAAPDAFHSWLAAGGAGGAKRGSLRRRRAAVAHHHRVAGHGFDATLYSVGHEAPAARPLKPTGSPRKRAAPLTGAELGRIALACPRDARGLRDRAMFLLGFAAALSRDELAALRLVDLRPSLNGFDVRLVHRNASMEADDEGRVVVVARMALAAASLTRHVSQLCPVRALEEWLATSGLRVGPLFCRISVQGAVQPGEGLGPDGVRLALAARARAAGLRPPAGSRLCAEAVLASA